MFKVLLLPLLLVNNQNNVDTASHNSTRIYEFQLQNNIAAKIKTYPLQTLFWKIFIIVDEQSTLYWMFTSAILLL